MVASSSPEQGVSTIKLWNLNTVTIIATLYHPDKVVAMTMHPTFDSLTSLCRDGNIRIFDIKSEKLKSTTPSHQSGKSGRLEWLGEEDVLLSIGFSKYIPYNLRSSHREIKIYVGGVEKSSLTLDTSPSILIPIYDPDTNVLILTGRICHFITLG